MALLDATPSEPLRSDAPAWYRDLSGRHEARFWDGTRWTADVMDRGVRSWDPSGSDEEVRIDAPAVKEPVVRPAPVFAGAGQSVALGLSSGERLVLFVAIAVAAMWIALALTRTSAVVAALMGS